MGAVLATLATLVILVLGGAFAVPHLVQWNDYRDVFETQASRLIGRSVKVRGDVNLTILPVPQITFENVSIANDAGSFDTPLAQVQSFDMMLSLSALLSGGVEASSVSLVKPVLRLSIDDSGRGDWRGLGARDATSFIVPRAVSLNNVSVSDGVIEVAEAQSGAVWRASAVTGEFAADSLEGPFKFNGAASMNGARRDVRFITAKSANGKLNIKGSVQGAASSAHYSFDGALAGFDAQPQYTGAVVMKMPLRWADGAKESAMEAKAQATLSLAAMKFDDLTVSVSDETRPQTMTGAASITRGQAPRFDVDLSGDWLNADVFATPAPKQPLLEFILANLRPLQQMKVSNGSGSARISVVQLGLYGEDLRNVSFELTQTANAPDSLTLKAFAPGDSDIRLSGRLSSAGDDAGFDGDGEISGANLSRFLKWTSGAKQNGNSALSKNFALKGKVALTGSKIRVENGIGELGGSAFTGAVDYKFADKGALTLSLESDRLDLRDIVSGDLTMTGLSGSPRAPDDAQNAATPKNRLSVQDAITQIRALSEAKVRLKSGVVELADHRARDVYADVVMSEDTLTIAALQFATDDGMRITAGGKLQSLSSAPDGDIKLSVEAASAEALETLTAVLGVPASSENALTSRAAGLAPLKVAGALKARGSAGAFDFKLDGLASGSAFAVEGRLEGDDPDMWRRVLTVDAFMSNADGDKLLTQIMPGAEATKAAGRGQGMLNIAASGRLDEALNGKITLRTPTLTASFGGQALPFRSPWEANGDLRIKSVDAAASVLITRLLDTRAAFAEPFALDAAMVKSGGVYSLSNIVLTVEGVQAAGSAKVDFAGGTPSIAASLEANSANAPRLFSMLLNAPLPPGKAEAISETNGVWPDRPFAASIFDGPRQSLTLRTKSLALGGGLKLENAEIAASLEQGALNIAKLEGDIFGGRFSAQGLLQKARGRYALSARAGLQNAKLESALNFGAPQNAPLLASGLVSLDTRLSGQGASPHGLVANLSGKGKVSFGQGVFYNFSPGAPERLAREQLESAEPAKLGLNKTLVALIRQGDFAYKKLRAPFVIRNGALQVRRASFRGAEHVLRSEIEVDLTSLRADSEWRLGVGVGRRALKIPPVKAVFAGALTELSALRMSVDSTELERFLAVKKIDRDVERLEKLNQYGRLPPSDIEPAPGPRLDKRKTTPDGASIQRQPLPPLRQGDAYSWKPSTENQPDIAVEESPTGAFEAKIRSSVGVPPSSAAAPTQPGGQAATAPTPPPNATSGQAAASQPPTNGLTPAQGVAPKPKRQFDTNEAFGPSNNR